MEPLNVSIRIYPTGQGEYIALLTNFAGGGRRLESDDPMQLVDDVHEWMDSLVEK